MPDDRMLHRCQGHSAKLAQCDHLTYRVWTQYLLSSDDYGVMVDEAAKIRGDNLALMRESEAEIRRCLDLLVEVGLVQRFAHQGQNYVCSEQWQDFQKITYPRKSHLPRPIGDPLVKLSEKTSELFLKSLDPSEADGHRLTANGLRLEAYGGSLHGGSHRSHASCGRVCVPAFLHTEFRTLLAGDESKADKELRAHYREWWDSLPEGQVPTEPLKWLKSKFAETYQARAVPMVPNKQAARQATRVAFLNRHKESA